MHKEKYSKIYFNFLERCGISSLLKFLQIDFKNRGAWAEVDVSFKSWSLELSPQVV